MREGTKKHEAYLLGVLSSTILDWQVRRWVEKNVTFAIFERLTIPLEGSSPLMHSKVIEIAGRLAAVDNRYTDWAAAVGVSVGSITTQAEKADLVAELDAVVAHLYGLGTEDLEVIWGTFHTTVDHLPRLEKVLEYHESWDL